MKLHTKFQQLGIFFVAVLLASYPVFAEESAREKVPSSFSDLITQYEETYGSAYLWEQDYCNVMEGLCYTKLLDFDQNGTEELLLVYNQQLERGTPYVGDFVWEAWSLDSGLPSKLGTGDLYGTDGGTQTLVLAQYNENWYVQSGGSDSFSYNYYYGYGPSGFGLVREALADPEDDGTLSYRIDGEAVPENRWIAEQTAWEKQNVYYGMNYVKDASSLLAACALTKSELGMSLSRPDGAGNTDFVLPNSSQEPLSPDVLQGMSAQALLIARNEIFARHGRQFKTPELQQYFDTKPWYAPQYSADAFTEIQFDILSDLEWANINLISDVEAALPAPAVPLISQAAAEPVEDPASFFQGLPDTFVFSSGVGAWGTTLQISSDGSFIGQYHDSEMGATDEGYPNGSVYICDFHGTFSSLAKHDDHIYSMKLETIETDGIPEETYVEDGVRYIYSEPYGMDDGEIFLIYLPGTPMSEVAEGFQNWLYPRPTSAELSADICGIYNVNGQQGFVGYYN